MAGSDQWTLYLVRCRGGALYTGIALNVEARLAQHRAGIGAKYLRGRSPLELVFSAPAGNRSRALRLEHKVKRLPAARKRELLDGRLTLQALE